MNMADARIPAEPIGWPLLGVPNDDGMLVFPSLADSVRQNIQVILSTRPGEQLMRPAYGGGLENLLSEPNTLATRTRIRDLIDDSLKRWEPRITVDAIAVDPVDGDPGGVRVEVHYRLRRNQQLQRVGMTLAMEAGSAN
jgi:phage baseplate assembly protein W